MLFVPRQPINREIADLTAGIANAGDRKMASARPTVNQRFNRIPPQRHPRSGDDFGWSDSVSISHYRSCSYPRRQNAGAIIGEVYLGGGKRGAFGVSVRSTAGFKYPFTRSEDDFLLAKLFEGATPARN